MNNVKPKTKMGKDAYIKPETMQGSLVEIEIIFSNDTLLYTCKTIDTV